MGDFLTEAQAWAMGGVELESMDPDPTGPAE